MNTLLFKANSGGVLLSVEGSKLVGIRSGRLQKKSTIIGVTWPLSVAEDNNENLLGA